MVVRTCVSAAVAVGAVASFSSAATPQAQRVYHIGNSVTDTINYPGLATLAATRGDTHNWGRHMIPGAPLSWIYGHPNDGFRTNPQAPAGSTENQGYPVALPNYEWDAITLQPFDRQLGTPTAVETAPDDDLPTIRAYLGLLRQNAANHDTSVYIYSRWPRRNNETSTDNNSLNYQQQWDRTYTGGWDGTNETRDYFQKVTDGTRTIVDDLAGSGTKNPVFMVPVGDVFYEIDKRAEAGQFSPGSGIDDVVDFYTDGIHFGNLGSYVVALTFYSTMYHEDPNGLGVPTEWANQLGTGAGHFDFPNASSFSPLRGDLTAADVALLQDAVWDVVNGHPYSGVNAVVPEPTTLGLLSVAGLFALRRHRR